MVKHLLVLLMFAGQSYAQDSTLSRWDRYKLKREKKALLNDQYKSASLYFNQTGFQDQRMSPLVFNGYGTALDLQSIRYSDKSFREFQMRGMYNLSNVPVKSSYLHFTKLDLNYSYHWRLSKSNAEKIYVGGTLNNMMNIRFYPTLGNNALAFDFSTGLSPSVVWVKEELCEKNLILQVKGGVNLVSYVVRYPQFVFNGTESKVMPITQFNRVFFEVGLSPILRYSKENRCYFAYVFDAYAFSSSIDGSKIRTYVNGFKFAYWLKTK